MKKALSFAATTMFALAILQGSAAAHHQTPPGHGLVEFPFVNTCNGVTTTVTVVPGESGPGHGPGWFATGGASLVKTFTVLDPAGDVVFETTLGRKTAMGLETATCTASLPDGSTIVVEVLMLP